MVGWRRQPRGTGYWMCGFHNYASRKCGPRTGLSRACNARRGEKQAKEDAGRGRYVAPSSGTYAHQAR